MQLDEQIIARSERTASMLRHIASVVETRPRKDGANPEVYAIDVMDALLHGAQLADLQAENLRHVAEVYDGKVAGPT